MTQSKTHVAVLGGGSFGTAIASILADNGHHVHLWLRDPEVADAINSRRENTHYFPGRILPEGIEASTDLASCVRAADTVFVSVPSKAFRRVVHEARDASRPGQYWVSTAKGVEPEGFHLMSAILREELPDDPSGVLSGPNLAEEMLDRCLTATVIASVHEGLRKRVQQFLGNAYFRVYANTDTYGVELAGALKNIYAIVSGLAAALKMGENTRAMLMTRALAEMSRFAVSMGANPMTFMGLAGVGDLIVTCSSSKSRNFRVGYQLGQGRTLDDIVSHLGQVAEGVETLKTVWHKAREMEVEMPLVNALYEIVYRNAPIEDVVRSLMSRQQSSDVEFILPRES